jgi:hypothetical protein
MSFVRGRDRAPRADLAPLDVVRLGLALIALAASVSAARADVSLIARNSMWKWDTTTTDPGTSWRDAGFSDAGWPSGPGALGYGDPWILTTVPYGPDPNNKYRTTYFRRHFNLAVPTASVARLILEANYDDGFVAYLNGVEIARRAMPAGAITYSTFASLHEGGSYEPVPVPAPVPGLVPGDNVLAIEVHQNSATSSDLSMDLALSYSTLVRGPYLQRGTPTGVVVRWRTTVATNSRVRYGSLPTMLTSTVDDAAVTTEHVVALTGLSPNTRYFYSVGSTAETLAGGDSNHVFVTAPIAGTQKPTRVWAIGDAGTKGALQAAVRNGYTRWTGTRATDLWLMLGDNAYDAGTDAEYQAAVFDVYPDLLRRSVLWPTRGNHDFVYAGDNNDYYDIFTMPTAAEAGGVVSGSEAYYSFDYANVHFICLDSEGTDRTPAGNMMTWLQADIAATTQDWVVAFWHHPPYTKGSHNSDDSLDSGGRMRDMRMNALPILDAAGADLVLTGHSHSYERSFLLDGHYGVSTTLTSAMKVDSGDGRMNGNGPYGKAVPGTTPHSGAVYVVAGSAGQTSGGTLNHPVMVSSQDRLGSLVLDVDGWRLDARFLDTAGVVRDSFTILKNLGLDVADKVGAHPITIEPARPNPASGAMRIAWTLDRAGPVRLSVLDASGRRRRDLDAGTRGPGRHDILWDGRDDAGRAVGAGVYFVLLESGSRAWARKVVRVK